MSRVLVVEDEAHLAEGLRFNLEAEGYSAEVVGDGEAATERLLAKKHGGKVFAESEGEGRGSTVTIELPRRMA